MHSSLWLLSTSGVLFFSNLLYLLIVNGKYTPVIRHQILFLTIWKSGYKQVLYVTFSLRMRKTLIFINFDIPATIQLTAVIPENFIGIGQKLEELMPFKYFCLFLGVPTLIHEAKICLFCTFLDRFATFNQTMEVI